MDSCCNLNCGYIRCRPFYIDSLGVLHHTSRGTLAAGSAYWYLLGISTQMEPEMDARETHVRFGAMEIRPVLPAAATAAAVGGGRFVKSRRAKGSTRLRMLCLHGYGSNNDITELQVIQGPLAGGPPRCHTCKVCG